MRSFKLHDGEDDTVTDEMNLFLKEWHAEQSNDWDGNGSGISLYITVDAGDTILMRDDLSVRVLRQGEPVRINSDTFPMVYAAFLMVEMDNGAHHVNRIAEESGIVEPVNLTEFEMPYDYGVHKLVLANETLSLLHKHVGEDGLSTFVIGEQSEQEDLIKQLGPLIPGIRVAHALINDWFNAWEKDPVEAEGPTAATRDPDGVQG
jgi:hypothetical protein